MSDTVRHIRIDDDLWETIQALPGKTTSDKLRGLLAQTDTRIDELLELGRGLPSEIEGIVDRVMQRKIDERAAKSAGPGFTSAIPAPAAGSGFPIRCAHCRDSGRGSTKNSTICFDCKGAGHTLTPAECPVCCDAGTGAL